MIGDGESEMNAMPKSRVCKRVFHVIALRKSHPEPPGDLEVARIQLSFLDNRITKKAASYSAIHRDFAEVGQSRYYRRLIDPLTHSTRPTLACIERAEMLMAGQ